MPFEDDDRDLDYGDRIDPSRRKKNRTYQPEDDSGRAGKKRYDRKREERRISRDWDDYEDEDDSL